MRYIRLKRALPLHLEDEANLIFPKVAVVAAILKNLSTLEGVSWTAYAFGAALGPVVIRRAFDRAGAYQSGFIMLLSLPCLAGASRLRAIVQQDSMLSGFAKFQLARRQLWMCDCSACNLTSQA